VDHDALDALALSAAPGSEGMVLVPYLAGERTPNRPDATGTLHGIRTEVSRGALARAAFEGVVCSLLEGLDALGAAGVPLRDDRLVLVGGGSGSAAYRQVLATLAARPVVVPGSDQIVAAGAAVQAAVLATGSPPGDIADAWGLRTGAITEPGPGVAEAVAIRGRYADARG
jgi:xylulokinase